MNLLPFFEIYESEWGDILYIPTRLGDALLTIEVALSLFFAVLCIQITKQNVTMRKFTACAFCVGFAVLLSNIKLDVFDNGGNVTLFSMLMVMLPAYFFGPGAGIFSGLAYGLVQMIVDPYLLFPAQIAVDYVFAFAALGICGFFYKSKGGLIKGYIIGVLGRYFFAVLSGAVFFGDYAWEGWHPIAYSMAYNATYIFMEAGVTIGLLCIPFIRSRFSLLKEYVQR